MTHHILDKIMDEQDRDFVRVLEDLIDVLIAQGIITMDMMPPEAVEKLTARRQMRKIHRLDGARRAADPTLIDQKIASIWAIR